MHERVSVRYDGIVNILLIFILDCFVLNMLPLTDRRKIFDLSFQFKIIEDDIDRSMSRINLTLTYWKT